MSIGLLPRLAFRNVWRNPRRSMITLSAITIAVGGTIFLSSLARGISHQILKDAIHDLTGHVQIHAKNYLDDPAIENSMTIDTGVVASKLKQSNGVSQWVLRVRVPAVVVSEHESIGVTVVGIDPNTERGMSLAGDAVSQGRGIGSIEDTGIVLGERLAEDLETQLGRRVVLMSQGADGEIAERGFRIVGLFRAKLESTEKRFVFLGRKAAQDYLRMGNKLSEISLKLRNIDELDSAATALKSAFPDREVGTWKDVLPMVSSLLKVQSGFLFLWLMIVVCTVSFGLINTLFMALFERIRELGMLQALGMRPSLVVKQILLESATLLIIGAVAGSGLSLLLVFLFSDGIDISGFSEGTEMFGFSRIIYPTILPSDFIMANVVVVVIGAVFSFYPARYAAKLTPAEALRRA